MPGGLKLEEAMRGGRCIVPTMIMTVVVENFAYPVSLVHPEIHQLTQNKYVELLITVPGKMMKSKQ